MLYFYFKISRGKSTPSTRVLRPLLCLHLTYDVSLHIMACRYYCSIMLLLLLLLLLLALWFTLRIRKCFINDSSSFEKRDGKCLSFNDTYKYCHLQALITPLSVFFSYIFRTIIIKRFCWNNMVKFWDHHHPLIISPSFMNPNGGIICFHPCVSGWDQSSNLSLATTLWTHSLKITYFQKHYQELWCAKKNKKKQNISRNNCKSCDCTQKY